VIASRGCLEPPPKKQQHKGKALAKGKGKDKDKERKGGREGGEGEQANSAVCTCSAAQEGRWWYVALFVFLLIDPFPPLLLSF
jgi:hypothetical protein